MRILMGRKWQHIFLKGIIILLYGFFAFAAPNFAFTLLILIFAFYLLVNGFINIFISIKSFNQDSTLPFIEGIGAIILGIVFYLWPVVVGDLLIYLISIWAISTSFFKFIKILKDVKSEDLFQPAIGILLLITGILILFTPKVGLVIIMWSIGLYSIIAGMFFIHYSFILKNAYFKQRYLLCF